MRRLAGVMLVAALAAPLLSAIALGAVPPALGPGLDLRPQLMLRLFGETTDSGFSLAAAYGDRTSESLLRNLALGVARVRHPAAFEPDLASAPTFAQVRARRVASSGDILGASPVFTRPLQASRFSAPAAPPQDGAGQSDVVTYQPDTTMPVAPARRDALSLAPLGVAFVPETVHLGRLQFSGTAGGETDDVPQASLHDSTYGAGANFSVRAGRRNVDVGLSSSYEHLTRNDASTFSLAAPSTASSWQLPGSSAPFLVPNYADMSKLAVGAAVAVPVREGLTLNVNYGAQRLYGEYGLPGTANLDSIANTYGGALTFALPHSSSTVSISASQYRYQDTILPANASTQTNADVNFTVKF